MGVFSSNVVNGAASGITDFHENFTSYRPNQLKNRSISIFSKKCFVSAVFDKTRQTSGIYSRRSIRH